MKSRIILFSVLALSINILGVRGVGYKFCE